MLSRVITAVLLAASAVLAVVGGVKLNNFAKALEAHQSVSGGAGSFAFMLSILCLVVVAVLIWGPWKKDS